MEKENTVLIIRIPVMLKKQLEKCALNSDLTSSQEVRKLIREYVRKNLDNELIQKQSKLSNDNK